MKKLLQYIPFLGKKGAQVKIDNALGTFAKVTKDLTEGIEGCKQEIEEAEKDLIAEREKFEAFEAASLEEVACRNIDIERAEKAIKNLDSLFS